MPIKITETVQADGTLVVRKETIDENGKITEVEETTQPAPPAATASSSAPKPSQRHTTDDDADVGSLQPSAASRSGVSSAPSAASSRSETNDTSKVRQLPQRNQEQFPWLVRPLR